MDPTSPLTKRKIYVASKIKNSLMGIHINRLFDNIIWSYSYLCFLFVCYYSWHNECYVGCILGSFMHGLLLPVLACSILGTSYRQKLRTKYNLVQAPAEDWSVHLFCPCCALCQEYRELKNRGIDPSKGDHNLSLVWTMHSLVMDQKSWWSYYLKYLDKGPT